MHVVGGGRLLWIYTLIFTSLQFWGRLSASTSPPTLPAPILNIDWRSGASVVLICKVPEGHHGTVFMLYRLRKMVDSQELRSGAEEAQFTINMTEGNLGKLFCCLYKDQEHHYSAFSPYLKLERRPEDAPTRSAPSFPPPVLSVEPSTGVVKCGDTLTFCCSVPHLSALPHSQTGRTNKPETFLLLRGAERIGPTSVIPQSQAGRESSPVCQQGAFTVGPVRGGEQGEYTCMYQINERTGLINSAVSNMVQVTVAGSPAYPGARFDLYLADNEHPVATHHATAIHHQATFPVPVQDSPMVMYQCQYSVRLGEKWSNSERSQPLALARGISPPSLESSGVDWPLVLGSFSAVVLFLCSVALVVVVAHRKVKAAAKKRRKREEVHFWTQMHSQDHIVDLTLRRSSFTSQDWASRDTETASRSPLWNSLSTFTTPVHPVH